MPTPFAAVMRLSPENSALEDADAETDAGARRVAARAFAGGRARREDSESLRLGFPDAPSRLLRPRGPRRPGARSLDHPGRPQSALDAQRAGAGGHEAARADRSPRPSGATTPFRTARCRPSSSQRGARGARPAHGRTRRTSSLAGRLRRRGRAQLHRAAARRASSDAARWRPSGPGSATPSRQTAPSSRSTSTTRSSSTRAIPHPVAGRAGLATAGPGEASFDEFVLETAETGRKP